MFPGTAGGDLVYQVDLVCTAQLIAVTRRLASPPPAPAWTSTSPKAGKRRPDGPAPSDAWTPGSSVTSRDPGGGPAVLHLRADGISWYAPPGCSSTRASRTGRLGPSGSDPAEARHDRDMDRRQQHRRGLRDVFSVDMTGATGRCAGCGNTGPLAEGRIFSHSPGLVLCCPPAEKRSCA
jgi:hypothetical protein